LPPLPRGSSNAGVAAAAAAAGAMTVAEVVAACRDIEGALRGAAQELSGMLLKVGSSGHPSTFGTAEICIQMHRPLHNEHCRRLLAPVAGAAAPSCCFHQWTQGTSVCACLGGDFGQCP
jgi:hypothetical protein